MAVGLFAGLASPALAKEGCTCRGNGQEYEQGQVACIRGKLARCTMNLNNSSWKIIEDLCPESSLRRHSPWLVLLPPSRRWSLPTC